MSLQLWFRVKGKFLEQVSIPDRDYMSLQLTSNILTGCAPIVSIPDRDYMSLQLAMHEVGPEKI